MKINPKYLIIFVIAFVFSILGCKSEINVVEITGNVIIKSVEYDFRSGLGDTLRTEDAEGIKIVLFEGEDSIAATSTISGVFSFENVLPGTYYAQAIITDSIKEESADFIAEAGQTVFCPDIVFEPYPSSAVFSASPTPFNTLVILKFVYLFLRAPYKLCDTLKIYDTKGEEEILFNVSMSPNAFITSWEGPDSTSLLYPNGNYFATLSVGGSQFFIINVIKE